MTSKYYNNNTINKQYKTCGCIIISDLDIIENIITDIYLQYCKQHYTNQILNNKILNNSNSYIFSNKLQKYIINNSNQINNDLKRLSNNKSSVNNKLDDSTLSNKTLTTNELSKKINSSHVLEKSKYFKNNPTNLNASDVSILMDFGKYANKTYDYVYCNDKMYCYKLAFWNKENFKNQKILNFINYIKKQLLIE